jgi:DNA-binding CsgD family transcriptional regulator
MEDFFIEQQNNKPYLKLFFLWLLTTPDLWFILDYYRVGFCRVGMIKEIKINSNAGGFDSQPYSSRVEGNDLLSLIALLDKCCGQYCIIVDVVESSSYAAHKHKLHEISNLLSQLTKRESEVLSLAIKGMHNKSISAALNISVETVKSHRKKIVSKVGLNKVNDLLNILYDIFLSKTFQRELNNSNR